MDDGTLGDLSRAMESSVLELDICCELAQSYSLYSNLIVNGRMLLRVGVGV